MRVSGTKTLRNRPTGVRGPTVSSRSIWNDLLDVSGKPLLGGGLLGKECSDNYEDQKDSSEHDRDHIRAGVG